MKPKKRPTRYLTDADILRALAVAGHTSLFLDVGYCTGCRVGELCRLRWSDVDLQEGTAIVRGKGNKERLVLLGASVRALRAAQDGHQPGDRIFPFSPDAARKRLRTVGRRVGFELRPHLLRHSMATEMLNAGAPLAVVAELLGHSSWQTTANHYWQRTDPRLQAMRRSVVTSLPRARKYWLAHPSSWADIQREQIDP